MKNSTQREIIEELGDVSAVFSDKELHKSIDYEWSRAFKMKNQGEDSLKDALTKVLTSHGKTKKRWVKKEETKGSSYEQEMADVSKVWTGKNGVERFRREYGHEDFHAYKNAVLDEMKAWAEEGETLSVQFRYFGTKLQWQKEAAIRSDIKILCIRKLLRMKGEDNKPVILSQLNSWSAAVVDYSGRGSFPEFRSDDNLNQVGVLTIKFPDGTNVRQELTVESARNDLYASPLMQKLLSGWDISLMRFVLHKLVQQQYRNEDIITTRKEVLEFMGKPLNGRNYELVLISIKKLIALKIFIDSPTDNFNLGFLASYKLKKGKQESLIITLDKDVYTEALSGKITSMYKEVIDSLSSAAAAIIYRLQILRIQRHSLSKSPIVRVDLHFFKSILVFNNQRKDRIYRAIEDSLDEIVSAGATLKDFSRITEGLYELEFLPLSDSEMHDLGTSITNEEHLAFPLLLEPQE